MITAIRYLRELGNREREPLDKCSGLCLNAIRALHTGLITIGEHKKIKKIMGSANTGYPVHGGMVKYTYYNEKRINMWGHDQYGIARREYCRKLADKLELMEYGEEGIEIKNDRKPVKNIA